LKKAYFFRNGWALYILGTAVKKFTLQDGANTSNLRREIELIREVNRYIKKIKHKLN